MLADLPVASWVLDRRTRRFLDVNDAAVELYGFSRDDFARMTLADIWPTDEVDGLLGMLDRAGSTVRSSGPWQHRHQDGHPLDVLISARRVDRDGRSTVVIVAEDATTQRREEARLRASEERLRLALAAGQMGTWEWRPFDDWIVWEGPPGGPPGADTWRGKLVDFLHLVHPDDQEGVTRALNQSVVGRTDLAVEFRVVAPGGATRWIMAFGRVIPDEQGAPALMIGLAVDLTDRKGLEDRVVRSERLGMLGQLAAGISHDLNQSLALIGGYGDLAEQALTLPAPDLASLVDYVGIICKAASDASEAVHRLLTFARGHEPVQPQPVDVANLLRDVARLTAPRWRDLPEAEGRPVSLEIEIVDPTPALTVVGWPASLREALTNLIFNAVDALPNGGTIRLTGRRQHDAVVVEVADNGIGMPLEVRPRIF